MNVMNSSNRLTKILLAVPVLLLIPFVGMQISSDVNWSLFDFVVMGILLAGVGVGIELILRNVHTRERRFIFIAIICVVFLLVWAELAVGVFGSPFAGS